MVMQSIALLYTNYIDILQLVTLKLDKLITFWNTAIVKRFRTEKMFV